jgi:hypothetical protein
MREKDCVELAAFEFRFATVLRLFFAAPLEHAAVDKDARVLCDKVIGRTGYITCCAVKMNFHF